MKNDEQPQSSPLPQGDGFTKKTSVKHKVATILPWLIIVLLIGVVAFLVFTNQLRLNTSKTGQVVSSTNVCGDDIVKQYNNIVKNAFDTTTEARTKTNQKVQALVDTFQKDAAYAKDPTCLFISYTAAYAAGNKDVAKSYVDSMTTYADMGVFVDTRIIGLMSITQLQAMIAPPADSTGDGLGSG